LVGGQIDFWIRLRRRVSDLAFHQVMLSTLVFASLYTPHCVTRMRGSPPNPWTNLDAWKKRVRTSFFVNISI